MNLPKPKLAQKLENNLDFEFNNDVVIIDSVDDFNRKLLAPYKAGQKLFYRGERLSSLDRPLLPSIFRERQLLLEDGKMVDIVDAERLCSFYASIPNYFDLYQKIIGEVKQDNLYSFLAFSQHYYGVSPLIDFTKSLYVCLSFALKDRTSYDKDILIYTLEIKNQEDYTNDIGVANQWIRDYSVMLFNNSMIDFDLEKIKSIEEYKRLYNRFKGYKFLDITSPSAKLIDVPTNDLMRFQQGVFLLLDDFTLLGNAYLTRKMRDEFTVKKYLISKDICPKLLDILMVDAPYYAYKNITDLSKVVDDIKKQGMEV